MKVELLILLLVFTSLDRVIAEVVGTSACVNEFEYVLFEFPELGNFETAVETCFDLEPESDSKIAQSDLGNFDSFNFIKEFLTGIIQSNTGINQIQSLIGVQRVDIEQEYIPLNGIGFQNQFASDFGILPWFGVNGAQNDEDNLCVIFTKLQNVDPNEGGWRPENCENEKRFVLCEVSCATSEPTKSPSNVPTESPSNTPNISPTSLPTNSPISLPPTISQTKSPTFQPSAVETESPSEEEEETSEEEEEESDSEIFKNIAFAMFGVGFLALICAVVMIFFYRSYQIQHTKLKTKLETIENKIKGIEQE